VDADETTKSHNLQACRPKSIQIDANEINAETPKSYADAEKDMPKFVVTPILW
jgi:hypothetical protein